MQPESGKDVTPQSGIFAEVATANLGQWDIPLFSLLGVAKKK